MDPLEAFAGADPPKIEGLAVLLGAPPNIEVLATAEFPKMEVFCLSPEGVPNTDVLPAPPKIEAGVFNVSTLSSCSGSSSS